MNGLSDQVRRGGTGCAVALAVSGQLLLAMAHAETASEPQIRDTRRQYDSAMARRDFVALSKLTTAEVQMTGPAWRTTGSASLQGALNSLVERRPDVTLNCDVEAIEVNETWNVAAERGRWRETWTEKGSPVDLRGSYLAMWKRIDGKWLLDAWLFVPQSCNGDSYCKGK
jgi:ketosteroid isomerase-like protein